VEIRGRIGSVGATAQVNPAAFTIGMMHTARARGAELKLGTVTGLLRRGGNVVGVDLGGESVEADAIGIAMGPWPMLAARWLSFPAVWGLKGHSIVFETGALTPPEALFLEFEETDGSTLSPEVFPRPDGTAYVCAISTESALPVDPASVVPDGGAIDRLKSLCARISPVLAGSRVLTSGACHRPITRDGLPLIGAVPGARGVYVATGHGVWGIPGRVGCPVSPDNRLALSLEFRSPHARYAILNRRAGRWGAELFALPYDWELAASRAENIASGAWRDALTVGSVT
jgi:glycine/D-amino acid oxidase-like deaminating enzyme